MAQLIERVRGIVLALQRKIKERRIEKNMRKIVLLSVLLVAILGISIVPAYAFVNPNGTSTPGVNSAYELYGPHVAGIQVTIYTTQQAEWTSMNILNAGSTGSANLDLEDWALTQAWITAWTGSTAITLQNYGGENGYYILDMNNNATLPDGSPNPMADIYIREAIAYLTDRYTIATTITAGLGLPMYTICPLYMSGVLESSISPTGGNASLTYAYPGNSSSDPALAAAVLNSDPYLRVSGGVWQDDYATAGTWVNLPTMTFYVRSDDPERTAIGNMIYTATQNIPGLPPLPITESPQPRAICSNNVMGSKNYAMYTGAWTGIGPTPDVFFDLYAQEAYWNPGKPPNYDHISFNNTADCVADGFQPYGTDETQLETYLTQDYYALSVPVGIQEAKNAQYEFALLCASVPLFCHSGFKAVSDTPAADATAGYWQQMVNLPSIGMNNWYTTLDAVAPGSASPSTLYMQYGFKSDLEPANILYAGWYWDSQILDRIYDSGATLAPDLVTYVPQLFKSWSVGTYWDYSDSEYDTYVNLTLRPDLYWQDGLPVTIADVYYTLVKVGKDLIADGLPPPVWWPIAANFLDAEIFDAYNMQILLNVHSVWAIGWVLGSVIIPMHIWEPMISNYVPADAGVQGLDPTMASADPNRIGTGPFRFHSYAPGVSAQLDSNTPGSVVNGIVSPGYYQYAPLRVDIAPDNNLEKINLSPYATSVQSNITISLYNLCTSGNLTVTKYVYVSTAGTAAAALAGLATATPSVTSGIAVNTISPFSYSTYALVPSETEPLTLTLPAATVTFVEVACLITADTGITATAGPAYVGSWVNVTLPMWVTILEDIAGSNLYQDLGYGTNPLVSSAMKNYVPTPDCKVDGRDLALASNAVGTIPGYTKWNPVADILHEYKIDAGEVTLIAEYMGWSGPIPPAPLSVSISPSPSATVYVNEVLLFTSAVSGGTPPYSYQWFMNSSAVSGATSDSWVFNTSSPVSAVVYLNVTDSTGNTTQSNTVLVTVLARSSAINVGLLWLAEQQDPVTGAWGLDYYPIASTAFAIIKFATYESETGDTTYDSNVTAGLKYLLSSGSSFQVNITADLIANPAHWTGPGTPTTNGDGLGIYFRSTVGISSDPVGPYSSTYETGVVMMALEAADRSGYINRYALVPAGSDPAIAGKTYYVIMGDMVNFYAWAQNDASSGTARGGWRYTPNTEDSNPWGPTSDNSVSQWPVLGLMAAQEWEIYAPTWVKSELLNYWLAYSQDPSTGGFIYSEGSGPSFAMTAAGLIELTYCGVPTTDPRWIAARNYIGNNWGSDNLGNMYAMYAVMKAAMTAQPGVISDFAVHDWQEEYDDYLVNVSQIPPGYWPATGRDTAPTEILATEWALLILEKIAPNTPTVSVSKFFTDPCLNPLPLDSNGNPEVKVILACGTVRSTDPCQILAWVNVTNTAGVPLQSLQLNETLPVDWMVPWCTDPPCMPALPCLGAIHVYFADTRHLDTNPDITQPSTITVSTGNPEVVRLAIPNFNATAIRHPLMPGQSILLLVKLTYDLIGTSQPATNYPRNYTDRASAAAWPQCNYAGTSATGGARAFFTAYAEEVHHYYPGPGALLTAGAKGMCN